MSVNVAEITVADSQPADRRRIIMALLASVTGFSLDLFDYSILLYLATTVGPLFFPASIPTLSLAGVYAAYGTSAVVRPAGAMLFGNFADRHGRRTALLIAMSGVGIVTALMGTLPTVPRVGIIATVFFLMLRLLQGLFVGGVLASTHTIGTETVPPSWRGWVSGLIGGAGSGIAQLLSALVFLVVSRIFPGPAFVAWGWRCMFFAGLVSSVLALFFFYYLEESPLFVELQKKKQVVKKAPIKVLFSKEYRKIALLNVVIAYGAASMFYIAPGYMPTFLNVINHLPLEAIARILLWGGVGAIVLTQTTGHLSEIFGRRKAFWGIGLLGVLVFGFGYQFLATTHDANKIVIVSLAIIWLGSTSYSPLLVFLNERFPTAIRATGTAFCWNIGFAAAGLVPLVVSLSSPKVSDIPSRLMVSGLISSALLLIGPALCKETRGQFT